jgi:hypothetical protein
MGLGGQIVDNTGGKEMTFNMETGEMSEKKQVKDLDQIAEGNEEDD